MSDDYYDKLGELMEQYPFHRGKSGKPDTPQAIPTPEEKLAAEMYPEPSRLIIRVVEEYEDTRQRALQAAFLHGHRLGKAEGDAEGYQRGRNERTNIRLDALYEAKAQGDADGYARAKAEAGAQVTAAEVLAWLEARPGASWKATAQDIQEAVLAIAALSPTSPAPTSIDDETDNLAQFKQSPVPGAGERAEDKP